MGGTEYEKTGNGVKGKGGEKKRGKKFKKRGESTEYPIAKSYT